MTFHRLRIGFLAVSPLILSVGVLNGAVASDAVVRDENKSGAWRAQSTQGDVTNNGAFSYQFPIEIPAFRGLEPKLALAYNSSRKTKTSGDYQG